MSNHHLNWVLQYSDTAGNDRMVLIVLANYANPGDGQASPSITTLARLSKLSIEQVEESLGHLQELGVLVTEKRAGRAPGFTIVMGSQS